MIYYIRRKDMDVMVIKKYFFSLKSQAGNRKGRDLKKS